jgi:hypothetical protein
VNQAVPPQQLHNLLATFLPLEPPQGVVPGTAGRPAADLIPTGRGTPGLAHFYFSFSFHGSEASIDEFSPESARSSLDSYMR